MHLSKYPGCSLATAPKDIPFVQTLADNPNALDNIAVGDPFLRVVLCREYLWTDHGGKRSDDIPTTITRMGSVDKLIEAFERELKSLKRLGCQAAEGAEWFIINRKQVRNWPTTPEVLADTYAGNHDLQADAEWPSFRRVFEYLPKNCLVVAKAIKMDLRPDTFDDDPGIRYVVDEYKPEPKDRSIEQPRLDDFDYRQMGRRCTDESIVYLDIEPAIEVKLAQKL